MELNKILANQPAYRKKQIQEAIYKQLISDWDQAMTLPKGLRDELKQTVPLEISAEILSDGRTRKALITLNDGLKIESVLITNRDNRHTVCVSSQVGCPMACTFCATGKMGFSRNLTVQEIVNQVLLFSRELKKSNSRVDNVVFMGMGEPLLNLFNVLEAIELINSIDGLGVGARFISISTCGIPESIREIIEFPLQINLAISLHAPNDELRSELMPIASQFSVKEIWRELKNYISVKKRKVMIEYVMIDKINDNELYAEELAGLVMGLSKGLVMINLIPYNPTGKYKPSPQNQIQKFKRILENHGIEVIIRESFGGSISGACGQLANKK